MKFIKLLSVYIVHLRIRQIDPTNKPKSLLPSGNALTFWQIEAETNVLNCIHFNSLFYKFQPILRDL